MRARESKQVAATDPRRHGGSRKQRGWRLTSVAMAAGSAAATIHALPVHAQRDHFEHSQLRDPNSLGVHEFANAGSAELATETGSFHTTKRQTRIGRDHGIDEHHSALKL